MLYRVPTEVECAHAQNRPKGPHGEYRSDVGVMGSYDCVRMVILSFVVSMSLVSPIYWLWQSSRSAPREGDNVMVT